MWAEFVCACDWAVLRAVDADGAWRRGLWVDEGCMSPLDYEAFIAGTKWYNIQPKHERRNAHAEME